MLVRTRYIKARRNNRCIYEGWEFQSPPPGGGMSRRHRDRGESARRWYYRPVRRRKPFVHALSFLHFLRKCILPLGGRQEKSTLRRERESSLVCTNKAHQGSPHPSRFAIHLPRWGRLAYAKPWDDRAFISLEARARIEDQILLCSHKPVGETCGLPFKKHEPFSGGRTQFAPTDLYRILTNIVPRVSS